MKKLYTIAAAAIAALTVTSSADVFIIERTNGEPIELNVETIKEMRFKTEDEETGNLAPETVEIVDLGLSVCWASHNVGATNPTENGWYVMWGDTELSQRYSWTPYPFGNAQGLTKYNNADGLLYLQSEDDVASVEWGTDWRMPTRDEVQELLDNCDIEWDAEMNGVRGVYLASRMKGYEDKHIFLPLNGYIQDNIMLDNELVYLWTNEVCQGFYQFAFSLSIKPSGDYAGFAQPNGMFRYLGLGVRPVYTKKVTSEHPPVVTDNSIDLGLSVKWATCNVGAETEEGIGDYFAWGETQSKEDYSWATYAFGSGATSVTKYGKSDKITTLEAADDAATKIMGEEWRTPTSEEMAELLKNCTISADEVNGVNGFRLTSKIEGFEGKSIFLPVSGEMHGTDASNLGVYADLWTSTLTGTSLMNQGKAYGLQISLLNPADAKTASFDRCYGLPVRAVKAK